MIDYLRARWGEVSTNLGLLGIGLALAMIGASFYVRYDLAQIMRDVGKPVLAAGLIGVLIPDRKRK